MKFLVVDDELDVQTLFKQRFRKEIKEGRVDFVFATSGELALEYLNENHHEAVLIPVLCDGVTQATDAG